MLKNKYLKCYMEAHDKWARRLLPMGKVIVNETFLVKRLYVVDLNGPHFNKNMIIKFNYIVVYNLHKYKI